MGKSERRAVALLAELGIDHPPVPVESVAHRLGLEIERAVLGDEISGVLVVLDGRGVIGVSTHQAPTRQRFTIAHECGHFVLHRNRLPVFIDKQFLKPYFAVYRNSLSGTGEDRMEREANSFAAALLMPAAFLQDAVSELEPDLTDDQVIETLARRFQVSRQSMSFRLANLAAAAGETRY